MAALNFPTSPTLNQIYTFNGKSWRWDGTAWKTNNIIGTVNTASQYQVAYYAASGTTISGSSNLQITGSGVTVAFSTASSSIYNGAFTVIGGAGIGQTLNVGGSLNLWNGSYYAGFKSSSSATGSTTYTLPASTPSIGTSVLSSDISGILSWVPMTATGGGGAGTVYNGSLNAIPYYPAAGAAITGSVNFTNTGTSINIGYTTAASNSSSGAFTVVGGVGIGGSLYTSNSYANSISGVVLDNGIVSSGSWAGNAITSRYGGTGYTTYTLGDILSGSSTGSLIKTGIGLSGQVLTANPSQPGGLGWASLTTATTYNYGSFIDTTTQTVLGANTATPIYFNTTIASSNVNRVGSGSTSWIQMQNAGTFNIQFSAQLNLSSGNQSKVASIWLRKNGVDVPDSTGYITVVGKDNQTIAAWNYVDTYNKNDYFELYFSSSDANMTVETVAAGTGPTRPVSPSMILTVVPVDGGFDPSADIRLTSLTGSTSFATGALTLQGGLGVSKSIYSNPGYFNSLSGVGMSNGVITTGSWAGSVITAYYGGTGIQAGSFTVGSLLFANSANTWSNLNPGTNGYFLVSAGTANTPVYTNPATLLVGSATTATNINVSTAGNNIYNPVLFTPQGTGSGVAVSSFPSFSFNPTANILNVSGLAVTSSTSSTSTSTGTLIVTGGVGIGGSLNVNSASSISSVILNSGTVYANLTGIATTASYSYQSGYGITAGFATTSYNVSVNSASTNASHYLLFSPNTTGSGIALSTKSALVYNPSTDILSVSGLAITSGTASTNTTTGALVVRGGLGVTGQLSFATASFGFTGITSNPSMSFIGNTSSSPITLTVLTDNSLSWEGSSGQLFAIDNNLSSGEIFSVSDISGLPIISASSGQTVSINEFGGYTKIGNGSINSSSSSTGSLVIYGGFGITGNAFIGGTTNITNTTTSTSTSSGALVVSGGVGIGGSLFLTSSLPSSLSGVVVNNGVITSGSWAGNLITAYFGGTGLAPTYTVGDILYANTSSTWGRLTASANSGYLLASSGSGATPAYINPTTLTVGFASTATYAYQSGYGLTAGLATTATYAIQSGYAITSGSSSTATTATYAYQSGYGITAGLATTSTYAYQAGYGITAGSANSWTTPRTLSLSGDLTGSVVWSGSGNTTLTATIAANSVALGTDTSGQYASTLSISGSGITATAANADDSTAYTIYSSAVSTNTASSIVLRDGSGNFSAGTITASLTGTASTATYALQSGYAITSGSSSTATTATNININNANAASAHFLNFSPVATGSGVAVSSNTTLSYNPSTLIMSTPGLAVTSSTASTSLATGALVITGGVGIGQSVFLGDNINLYKSSGVGAVRFWNTANTFYTALQAGNASANTTYTLPIAFPGSGTSVLQSDTSGTMTWVAMTSGSSSGTINVAAASGTTTLYFATTNDSTGTGFAVSSVSSLSYNTSASALSATGITATNVRTLNLMIPVGGNNINIYASDGTTQLMGINTSNGWLRSYQSTNSSSTTTGALVSSGGLGVASNAFIGGTTTVTNATASTSTTSGALVVTGGAGIGGSLFTSSSNASSISGVILNNGAITNTGTITATGVMTLSNSSTTAFQIRDGSNNSTLTIDTIGDIVSLPVATASTTTGTGSLVVAGGVGIGGSASIGGRLQMFNGANYTAFVSSASGNTVYTLPATSPATGTSVLQSTSAGIMSWVAMTAGGGSGTVTTLTAGTGISFSTGSTITTTGTIRAKRPMAVSFCAGYTPAAAGADSVVIRLPDSPSDGITSINYEPQEFHIRVETASATTTTIQLEKYTGTGAFSGTAITSVSLSGASTYEAQTSVFAGAGILLTSGDKLRINFTALSASHANFSVYLELEEV